MRITIVMVACAAAALPATLPAQRGDTTTSRQLGPGVQFRQWVDPSGPLVLSLVRVDLRRRDLELRYVRAFDQLRGREKTSDMVRRVATAGVRVPAAVNADFFNLDTGENENNQVLAGEWWKGLKVTDSPYDTYPNAHAQFALDSARRPMIERFILDARAWAHGNVMPIITLNFNPTGMPEGTALYTPRFGATTPRDTTRQTAEAPMLAAGHRGDTLLFVRRGAVSLASGSAIPAGGAVLAGYGPRADSVKTTNDGDTVKVLLTTLPRLAGGAAPALIVGGWPRILRDGVNVADDAATVEGTISHNAEVRNPRSAIGFSRDGTTLYLLTVDGRSAKSVGVTLVDLARIMRRLGAWQALNFDGGGSTTMVIDGTVVNTPSDTGGERVVGRALMVVRR